MNRKRLIALTAAALVLLVVVGTGILLRNTVFKARTITAYFSNAAAIYPGDEVRVAGVKVGTITAIKSQGTKAKMTLAVDRKVPVPADAKAIIIAQNLVGSRYVQLAPAYKTTGPRMPDGAVIDLDRTAVPVEWDEIKEQLTRLSTDLSPNGNRAANTSSVGRFIDSAANAMEGNGAKLRETIKQLSGLSRTLANGSGNIVEVVKNLQTFVTVLRDSNAQIVQFQDRLADVTTVLEGSRSDLDAALTGLSGAVVDIERFIAGSRDQTSEQVQRLANLTQNLVDNQMALKNVLHVAPNAIGNAYNIYNPDTGSDLGAFAFGNFSNPLQVICSAIGAVQNATASETSKLCSQYLGPALRLVNFNYLPFPFNAYLAKSPSPHNLIYSEPKLAPGGGGTENPAEIPPSISAYTGLNGDVPPPAGWGGPPNDHLGAYSPDGLPADPQPALYPGAPLPPGVPREPVASAPATLNDLLLPAESPAPPAQPAPGGQP